MVPIKTTKWHRLWVPSPKMDLELQYSLGTTTKPTRNPSRTCKNPEQPGVPTGRETRQQGEAHPCSTCGCQSSDQCPRDTVGQPRSSALGIKIPPPPHPPAEPCGWQRTKVKVLPEGLKVNLRTRPGGVPPADRAGRSLSAGPRLPLHSLGATA